MSVDTLNNVFSALSTHNVPMSTNGNVVGGGPPPYSQIPIRGGYTADYPRPNERTGLNTNVGSIPSYSAARSAASSQKQSISLLAVLIIVFATTVMNQLLLRDPLSTTSREAVRQQWDRERWNHQALLKEMVGEREIWKKQVDEQRTIAQREREQWQVERRDRERMRQEEREQAQREREQRREEEKRERANLQWEGLTSEKCKGYGTREYTAKLSNIPDGYDTHRGCYDTPLEIHGKLVKPYECINRGKWGGMWGKWKIDFDEVMCRTWWSNLVDKGCTAPRSGLHRFEQQLINIQPGDDWQDMCSTAPADFRDMHFDRPTSCANWGRHGIFGYWDTPDPSC